MTEISFTSTFRIPITQAGVNSAKKAKLKELIQSYPNGLIGQSKTGQARVSIDDAQDATFIAKLKKIGYKVYQKFEGENIDKENLDKYIKTKLDAREYNQKGKSPERLSKQIKDKRRFERNFTPKAVKEKPENITTTQPQKELTYDDIRQDMNKLGPSDMKIVEWARKVAEENYKNKMRQTEDYIKLCEEEGKDFAEAVFFGRK